MAEEVNIKVNVNQSLCRSGQLQEDEAPRFQTIGT
jgi:hypothetical protein